MSRGFEERVIRWWTLRQAERQRILLRDGILTKSDHTSIMMIEEYKNTIMSKRSEPNEPERVRC